MQGYEAIYDATTGKVMQGDNVALVEVLLSLNSPTGVAVQAALQQPLRCVFFLCVLFLHLLLTGGSV